MNEKEAVLAKLKGKEINKCPRCREWNYPGSDEGYSGVEENIFYDYQCTKCNNVWWISK